MELNFKSARKVSLSIWITHLVTTVVSLIWFIVIFATLSEENGFWPNNHFDREKFLHSIRELTLGIYIMNLSICVILLTLSVWLFTFIKTLPDGRAKKHIMTTLIIYFIALSYDTLMSFLNMVVDLPMFMNTFTSLFGMLTIAGWIMMIISSNYLNHFESSNAPKVFSPQTLQQWNPNMQYPGQQPNPWVQPQPWNPNMQHPGQQPNPWVQPQPNPQPMTNESVSKLEQAHKLKEKGLITEEEFQKIKNDILNKL